MLFSLALSGCGKTEVTIGDAIYNETHVGEDPHKYMKSVTPPVAGWNG